MDSEYNYTAYSRNSPASLRTPGNTVYLTDGSQAYELTPRRWISRAASFGVPGNDVIVIARSDGPLADLRFDLLQDTYAPAAIFWFSCAWAKGALVAVGLRCHGFNQSLWVPHTLPFTHFLETLRRPRWTPRWWR